MEFPEMDLTQPSPADALGVEAVDAARLPTVEDVEALAQKMDPAAPLPAVKPAAGGPTYAPGAESALPEMMGLARGDRPVEPTRYSGGLEVDRGPVAPPVRTKADELAEAEQADADARFRSGMGLAARQLVGGLTRTPVSQGLGAPPSRVPEARRTAEERRKAIEEAVRQKRQGALDKSRLALESAQTQRALREPEAKPVRDPENLTAYQRELVSARERDQKLRETEIARKTDAATARKEAGASAAASLKQQSIPFAGGSFRLKPGARYDKQLHTEAVRNSGLWNKAVRGMDDLEASIAAFAANPSPANKDAVTAKVNGVGGALNTAQGQGAMSIDEKRAMAEALGTDLGTTAGAQAFMETLFGDPKAAGVTMTRRARAARQSAVEMAKGMLESSNYDWQPPSAPAGNQPEKAATVNVKRASDGVVKAVSSESAKALVAKGGYTIVP